MKMIALEERFATPDIIRAWRASITGQQDLAVKQSATPYLKRRLIDLAEERLRCMDAEGIDVQVRSLTTPGVQILDPEPAIALARASNDLVAATVRSRPDRFQGFATLATSAQAEAARELERAFCDLSRFRLCLRNPSMLKRKGVNVSPVTYVGSSVGVVSEGATAGT